MLLSDRDIRAQIDRGALGVEPYDPAMLQPSSIDFLLGPWFRTFTKHEVAYIDPFEDNTELAELVVPPAGEPFILHPKEFALAATEEVFTLDDSLAARVEGKSSLGRLGLLTHSTAGFVDPGFSGQVTLELSNISNLPIKLWPGMKVGQLCVFLLSSRAENPYGHGRGSNYQDQRGPTTSMYYKNARPTTPKER